MVKKTWFPGSILQTKPIQWPKGTRNFQGTFGASAADETSAMAPLLKLGLA